MVLHTAAILFFEDVGKEINRSVCSADNLTQPTLWNFHPASQTGVINTGGLMHLILVDIFC